LPEDELVVDRPRRDPPERTLPGTENGDPPPSAIAGGDSGEDLLELSPL
jgi:hypothetical protein